MKTIKTIRQEKGAVAPLVAIMLILIIVCVALVVDLGHVHNVKVELQRAVDAAALAAAQQLPDGDAVGVAVAVGAANQADQEGVTILPADVVLGTWEVEITPGQSAADRFNTLVAGEDPTAVKVTATRNVDHVFFFFVDSTPVVADAIAVDLSQLPTVPLAVISCIPPTGPQAGELNICGVKEYSFSSNTNTAGWTSLTAGGTGGSSQTEIAEFFDENKDFFNEIVDLLDNTNVVSRPITPPYDADFDGCEGNIDTNIICGLGGEFEGRTTLGDPLTRYDELPRYITQDNDELHAFADIISQDGVLFKSSTESYSAYQTRLDSLYNGADIRYKTLIKIVKDKDDADGDGTTSDDIYVPDFNKALDYAGYPPVSSTTGAMATVMDKLLDQVANTGKKSITFKSQLSNEIYPFNAAGAPNSGARGETLIFQLPVIFAGSCDGFDPKSIESSTAQTHEDNELHYVGLANFLVTRIFKGGDCYQTVSPVTINPTDIPSECSDYLTTHEPEVLPDGTLSCPATAPPIVFEGLIRPPLSALEEKGLRNIVLVE